MPTNLFVNGDFETGTTTGWTDTTGPRSTFLTRINPSGVPNPGDVTNRSSPTVQSSVVDTGSYALAMQAIDSGLLWWGAWPNGPGTYVTQSALSQTVTGLSLTKTYVLTGRLRYISGSRNYDGITPAPPPAGGFIGLGSLPTNETNTCIPTIVVDGTFGIPATAPMFGPNSNGSDFDSGWRSFQTTVPGPATSHTVQFGVTFAAGGVLYWDNLSFAEQAPPGTTTVIAANIFAFTSLTQNSNSANGPAGPTQPILGGYSIEVIPIHRY